MCSIWNWNPLRFFLDDFEVHKTHKSHNKCYKILYIKLAIYLYDKSNQKK